MTEFTDGWISVKDRLPDDGQAIFGRPTIHVNWWSEVFDKDEPLGNMVEWKPMLDDDLIKEGEE